MIINSVRMLAIVACLQPHEFLIDIGCDHGYLGILSLQSQKIQHVINVDIHLAALQSAKNNFYQTNYTHQATFFLADGFVWNYPLKPAVAVMAGMGSKLMLQILKKIKPEVDQLVFLTHTLGYELRKWGQKNGWGVTFENYVEEKGVVYELISLSKKEKINVYTTEENLLFGLIDRFLNNQNQKAFCKYWNEYLNKIQKIPYEHQKHWHQEMFNKIQKILHSLPII